MVEEGEKRTKGARKKKLGEREKVGPRRLLLALFVAGEGEGSWEYPNGLMGWPTV